MPPAGHQESSPARAPETCRAVLTGEARRGVLSVAIAQKERPSGLHRFVVRTPSEGDPRNNPSRRIRLLRSASRPKHTRYRGCRSPEHKISCPHPTASSSTISSPRATMIAREPCPARPARTGALVRSPALPPRIGQLYRAQRKPRLSAQLVGSSPARRVDSTRSGWVSLQPPPRLTRRGSAQRAGEAGLTLAGSAA